MYITKIFLAKNFVKAPIPLVIINKKNCLIYDGRKFSPGEKFSVYIIVCMVQCVPATYVYCKLKGNKVTLDW